MGILINKILFWRKNKIKLPVDFGDELKDIIDVVKPYTMTSPERLFALHESVQYIVKNNIPGAIVECGVWKGGSMMAALSTLKKLNDTSRMAYLYDTFEGMSAPDENDKHFNGAGADALLEKGDKTNSFSIWCVAGLEEVKRNIAKVFYPEEKVQYIVGKVEDTLVHTIPDQIAILRLDTDWYQSTKMELEVLFPKLSKGGILIIDDYGHWQGSRKAVDEYIANNNIQMLLNRIDYTGRIGIKQ
jgi:Macrocin-O-methyltransferase (TylF).